MTFFKKTDKKLSIMARIAETPELSRAIVEARAAQKRYQEVWDGWAPLLFPNETSAGIHHRISKTKSPTEAASAMVAGSALTGKTKEAARIAAVVAVRKAAQETNPHFEKVLHLAKDSLSKLMAEAAEKEKAFFDSYGLNHEVTGASRQFAAQIARVQDCLDHLCPPVGSVRWTPTTPPARELHGGVLALFS